MHYALFSTIRYKYKAPNKGKVTLHSMKSFIFPICVNSKTTSLMYATPFFRKRIISYVKEEPTLNFKRTLKSLQSRDIL